MKSNSTSWQSPLTRKRRARRRLTLALALALTLGGVLLGACDDWRPRIVSVPPPIVESVEPAAADKGTVVRLVITGSGFAESKEGLQVWCGTSQVGQGSLRGSVSVLSDRVVLVLIDTAELSPGWYGIRVKDRHGQPAHSGSVGLQVR